MAIKISNLTFSYKNNPIFNNFSLDIKSGEVLSLIWWSWIWKTTFLKILCWYLKDYTWTIKIHGNISGLTENKIAVIGQENDLFDWLTVYDNLSIVHKIPDQKMIDSYLEKVGLTKYKSHYPSQLSGWMKKKLSLARALSVESEIIILDEAFSSLDAVTRHKLYLEFLEIIKSTHKTAIMITHDIDEAIALSDSIVILGWKPVSVIRLFNKWEPVSKDIIYNLLTDVY